MQPKKKVDIEELLSEIEGKVISKIKSQVKDPERVSVFVDGKFIFGLSKMLAFDLSLKPKLVLTQELLVQLKEAIIEEQIHRFFLNLLSRREHAAYELYQKAIRKGFSVKPINSVLELVKEKKIQSDQRYTELFVRSKNIAGWGPQKIRLYLTKNRIAKELIDKQVSSIELTDEAEFEQLLKLVLKKKKTWAKYDHNKQKEKIYRHLLQKGFKGNRILARLSELQNHLTEH